MLATRSVNGRNREMTQVRSLKHSNNYDDDDGGGVVGDGGGEAIAADDDDRPRHSHSQLLSCFCDILDLSFLFSQE